MSMSAIAATSSGVPNLADGRFGVILRFSINRSNLSRWPSDWVGPGATAFIRMAAGPRYRHRLGQAGSSRVPRPHRKGVPFGGQPVDRYDVDDRTRCVCADGVLGDHRIPRVQAQ